MIELVAPFSASGGSVVSVNGKIGVVVLTPEDIGALPDGALEGYATEEYVQEQIDAIEHPKTDLTGYATENYVKQEIAKAQLEGEDVDLSAYATKQYVSEQVNAIELMPGPQGPAGPKGNDGYTPVKGVDYFDGQKGNDGYTPVKGVDYFDGADGKDYVLTDADKAEIAGMVEVTGGGGSVNIDNATIIEEDGAIRTAIGGHKYLAPEEEIYHFLNESGGQTGAGATVLNGGPVENAVQVFDEAIKGKRKINYKLRWMPDGNTNQIEQSGEVTVRWDGAGYVLGGVHLTSTTFVTVGCNADINYYLKLPYSGKMIEFELTSPERYVYECVDSRYIDTDYFATREYVAELIGGIENGAY